MSNSIIQLRDANGNAAFPQATIIYPLSTNLEDESFATVGAFIRTTMSEKNLYSRIIYMRINTVTTGGGIFNRASFNIMAYQSSDQYGWAILTSDNATHNGFVFGRLVGGNWIWMTPTMTTLS